MVFWVLDLHDFAHRSTITNALTLQSLLGGPVDSEVDIMPRSPY